MKFNSVRVISWYGADEKLKLVRQQIHKEQCDWFKTHGLNIIVLTQEHEPVTSDITCIASSRLFPGSARNILLKDFYSSDEDFCIFADNDSVLYDKQQHLDGAAFINLIKNIDVTAMKDVDAFIPIIPQHQAFSTFFKKNETTLKHHFWFDRTREFKGSLFVLKNLKKYHGMELYFEQDKFIEDGKIIGVEDKAFGMNLVRHGLGVYQCKNIVLNEIKMDKSTWAPSKPFRTAMRQLADKKLAEYLEQPYNFNISKWLDVNFKKQNRVLVKKTDENIGLENFLL